MHFESFMPEKSNSEMMSKYLYYLGDEIGKFFFMIVFSLLQNNLIFGATVFSDKNNKGKSNLSVSCNFSAERSCLNNKGKSNLSASCNFSAERSCLMHHNAERSIQTPTVEF